MSVPRSGFRLPAMTHDELEAIERAIVGWGKAIRARPTRAPRKVTARSDRRPSSS